MKKKINFLKKTSVQIVIYDFIKIMFEILEKKNAIKVLQFLLLFIFILKRLSMYIVNCYPQTSSEYST